MKVLEYVGFSNNVCKCQYAIGEEGGKTVVVFVQGPLTFTSITNMIEVLASRILCSDLAGTDPATVRFFEYYPPALKPLRVWQEVSFEEHNEVREEKGLVAKLLQVVTGPGEVKAWTVDKPVWRAIEGASVPGAVKGLVGA